MIDSQERYYIFDIAVLSAFTLVGIALYIFRIDIGKDIVLLFSGALLAVVKNHMSQVVGGTSVTGKDASVEINKEPS